MLNLVINYFHRYKKVNIRNDKNSATFGEDVVGRIRIDAERILHHVSEIGRLR